MSPVKRKPVFLLIILLFSVYSSLSAAGGVLSGSRGELLVIRTEYFDVIYPEECSDTAARIASICDSMYVELCGLLNAECSMRIPVTITKSVESLNAYFSAVPYNRIVLYDTVPDETLDAYENTIEEIFYHELTHAVTMNIKSPLMESLSAVFGDVVNPAWLSLTTFWLEGATVSFESRKGGGRLNNPYNTQMVVQSKIEGCFPSWRDVTGARDVYPYANDAYMFGSMFSAYLQEKYGMEKYSEFWRQAGTSLTLSFCSGIFEKVYGLELDSAWEDFIDSIEIPDIKEPLNKLTVPELNGNKEDCAVSLVDSNEYGVVWYERLGRGVYYSYYSSFKKAGGDNDSNNDWNLSESERILSVSGVTRVSLCNDGRYLALTATRSEDNVKSRVYIYDLKKRKFVFKSGADFFDASIYRNEDGKLCLLSVSYREGLKIKSFTFEEPADSIDTADTDIDIDDSIDVNSLRLSLKSEWSFDSGTVVFSPCYAGDGKTAFIYRKALDWKIRIADKDSFTDLAISGGENSLIIRNLRAAQSEVGADFYFSWAERGKSGKMLPRAGIIRTVRKSSSDSEDGETFSVILQNEDFSGGAVACVPVAPSLNDGTDSLPSVIVLRSFFKSQNLCILNLKKADTVSFEIRPSYQKQAVKAGGTSAERAESGFETSEYRASDYYKKGTLFPVGMASVYDDSLDAYSLSFFGASFITSNPWGDRLFYLSACIDPFYGAAGVSSGFSGGNDSLSYSGAVSAVFDDEGFAQTSQTVSASKVIARGCVSSLSLGTELSNVYGKTLESDGDFSSSFSNSSQGFLYLKFSNVHKTAPGIHQKGGVWIEPYLNAEWHSDDYVNAGLASGFYVPGFFPLSLDAYAFPSSSYLFTGNAEIILFSKEIQKGIPAVSLYADRISVSAGYTGRISYDCDEYFDFLRCASIISGVSAEDYSDTVRLSFSAYATLNTGYFADSDYEFKVTSSLLYHPNPSDGQSVWQVALGANLVY